MRRLRAASETRSRHRRRLSRLYLFLVLAYSASVSSVPVLPLSPRLPLTRADYIRSCTRVCDENPEFTPYVNTSSLQLPSFADRLIRFLKSSSTQRKFDPSIELSQRFDIVTLNNLVNIARSKIPIGIKITRDRINSEI